MNDPDSHDRAVNTLVSALRTLLSPGGQWAVLSGARCQLLDGFPTCVTAFDVAVVQIESRWIVTSDGPMLPPEAAPRVGINVVAADTLENDTISTPNTLARTAVSEYVLFDPSAEVMRPSFQAFWKEHGELNRSWPAIKGTFFSRAGFRLDARRGELVVSKCGEHRTEEELFVLRYERDELGTRGLDTRIAKLEARLIERASLPRTRSEE